MPGTFTRAGLCQTYCANKIQLPTVLQNARARHCRAKNFQIRKLFFPQVNSRSETVVVIAKLFSVFFCDFGLVKFWIVLMHCVRCKYLRLLFVRHKTITISMKKLKCDHIFFIHAHFQISL